MKIRIACLAASIAAISTFATPARASLVGDAFTATVTHTGPAGGLVGNAVVNHTYAGAPSLYNSPQFGTFLIASPAAAPGYNNAILVDFSLFNYLGFVNQTGTIALAGLSEDVLPGSVAIFAGTVGMGANIASAVSVAGGTLSASWNTTLVFTPSPAAPDSLVLAWNSSPTPAPGAMALLTLAALSGRARRRRSVVAS